jgi:hypothetical protein
MKFIHMVYSLFKLYYPFDLSWCFLACYLHTEGQMYSSLGVTPAAV